MQKNWDINWFLLEILIIKEFCNLVGPEAHLATPNQKKQSQVLVSLWWLSSCKTLRYQLTLSWDIKDQRILQSDWMRGTSDHTQSKAVVSDAFALWLTPCKKW